MPRHAFHVEDRERHDWTVMFRELFQQSGLSLERLQTFCLVAGAGGVTKAANGDVNAQSLYSRQIKELEEFFGTALVQRSGRGIVLTRAGKDLATLAREHLSALSDFRLECVRRPQQVTLAAGDSLMRWLVLPRCNRLRAEFPDTSFVFLNLQSEEILRRLHEGSVDFGIVRDSGSFEMLARAPLGVLRYALFTRKPKLPKENLASVLKEQALATIEGDGNFKRGLAALFKAGGCKTRIDVECASFPLVAHVAASWDYAAVLPEPAESEMSALGFRKVESKELRSLDRKLAFVSNNRTLRIRPRLSKLRAALIAQLKA